MAKPFNIVERLSRALRVKVPQTTRAIHCPMPDLKRYRIGLDIGGTFTDFVLFDSEPAAQMPDYADRPLGRRARRSW